MWNRRHRWLRRLAAGLAFAALAVPTAQARIVEDSGIGLPNGQPSVDYDGYGYQHGTGVPLDQQNVPVLPDDRADRVTPEAGNPRNVQVLPDDRADRVTPKAGDPRVINITAPSSGFDWSDAGIGAGAAVGLVLLAFGAALATRRSGRKLANA
jgi:hypothetical protein